MPRHAGLRLNILCKNLIRISAIIHQIVNGFKSIFFIKTRQIRRDINPCKTACPGICCRRLNQKTAQVSTAYLLIHKYGADPWGISVFRIVISFEKGTKTYNIFSIIQQRKSGFPVLQPVINQQFSQMRTCYPRALLRIRNQLLFQHCLMFDPLYAHLITPFLSPIITCKHHCAKVVLTLLFSALHATISIVKDGQ